MTLYTVTPNLGCCWWTSFDCGELKIQFNVHQLTRAELRDSLMYHCHTVSGRTIQEGTGDANTSRGGLELICDRQQML